MQNPLAVAPAYRRPRDQCIESKRARSVTGGSRLNKHCGVSPSSISASRLCPQ